MNCVIRDQIRIPNCVVYCRSKNPFGRCFSLGYKLLSILTEGSFANILGPSVQKYQYIYIWG
jgi:hypothetical protein